MGSRELLNFNIDASPLKHVQQEVTAEKDIRKFATNPDSVILLDLHQSTAEEIFNSWTDELMSRGIINEKVKEDARDEFLTEEDIPQFKNTLRGTESGNWIVVTGEVPGVLKRNISFIKLHHQAHIGGLGVIQLVFFVITPPGLAKTKSAVETGKTFASLLTDPELRIDMLKKSEQEIRDSILNSLENYELELATKDHPDSGELQDSQLKCSKCFLGGIWKDLDRRFPWYLSDFIDGIRNIRAITKTVATIFFLYFACILPAIAFGVLNEHQTDGNITVEKMIYSQAIGGIIFALFGGQPLVILLSTAPLALYMKIIYEISASASMEFFSLYAWVGIWNGLFLVLYAVTEASVLMKYSTRFAEETFGFFISIAFTYDAVRPMVENFIENFYDCGDDCNREESLLFFILLFGTLIVGYYLWSLKSSPLLGPKTREFLSDYSLPIAVGLMTILGSGIFRPVDDEPFPHSDEPPFRVAFLFDIPVWGVFVAMGLGFILSLLFFMDQNISSAMVNTPDNRLKKGHAYHLDMYVVAVITIGLSMLGLPWIHAALPHSPLHVRALAEVETIYLQNGTIEQRIVRVRETRLTALVSHILIGLSVLMVPIPLQEIPVPVLYGVFLYLAATALPGSQFWQRLKLIFTERRRYPPNTYVRSVPEIIMHAFTFCQILCLILLCVFGFTPVDYVQMLLPIAIIALIPIRNLLIGKIFPERYLTALDPRMLDH